MSVCGRNVNIVVSDIGGNDMHQITELRAEKKATDIVLVTWQLEPNVINAPYQVWRSIVNGGEYELVGNGQGNAFLDNIYPVIWNEFIQYKVDSMGSSKTAQLYCQADPWLLKAASDYLWQLDYGCNATRAVAYCLGKTDAFCPECFSVEMNKRVKSTCGTCDGSGKQSSYVGPIPLKYAFLRYDRTMDIVGNMERDMEMITAWTANIPILNIGDIVINKDHVKYAVQSIPARSIMHSLTGDDEFIAKQTMVLRRLKLNEYPSLTYYENDYMGQRTHKLPFTVHPLIRPE